jgi:hypothetical protein
MNKEELLKKIDLLLTEAKMDEANAKTNIESMFCIGKQNGLLWAKYFILDLQEK